MVLISIGNPPNALDSTMIVQIRVNISVDAVIFNVMCRDRFAFGGISYMKVALIAISFKIFLRQPQYIFLKCRKMTTLQHCVLASCTSPFDQLSAIASFWPFVHGLGCILTASLSLWKVVQRLLLWLVLLMKNLGHVRHCLDVP